MPKLKEFRVEFERAGATYEPGEVVTGKVVLSLAGPKNVREIRLEAKGEAETHWTKQRTSKDSSGRTHYHTDHYRGHEHYFSVSNRLVGGSGGDSQTTLPAGQHSYHFSFHLPQNIPSSIEHELGHIRYTVKAVLDRPWRFDHKVVSAFTVNANYDLNTQQRLTRGIHDDIRESFWCCCFNFGGVKVGVKSRVTGFVPGETIELALNYELDSTKVDLTFMKMKLEKYSQFYASTPHSDKKTVTDVIRRDEKAGTFPNKGELTLKIAVPPLPPSRLDNCSIINISYRLALKIGVTGCHSNVSRVYPIEIGTVPLFYRTDAPTGPVTSHVPSAPSIDQITPSAPLMPQPQAESQSEPQGNQPIGFVVMSVPPYASGGAPQPMPEMPPPSYEECVSGSNTIADVNEQGMHGSNVQFSPRYPVYKFPMPMPYPP